MQPITSRNAVIVARAMQAGRILDAVASRATDVPRNDDVELPLPNVYWCTVRTMDGREWHQMIPADFTGSALQKMIRHTRDKHNFQALRSNSVTPMRRLKLSDLLENPQAFREALQFAMDNGEADTVKGLLGVAEFIAKRTSVVAEPDLAKFAEALATTYQ